MNSETRASALRMLKALARAIVEELQPDGKPIDPAEVLIVRSKSVVAAVPVS